MRSRILYLSFWDQLGNKELYCSTWPDLQWERDIYQLLLLLWINENIFSLRLLQPAVIVSGLSVEADFMIFFQFAGQQKMFTNNRLEDKKPAALQWVKMYSQVHVSVKLNLFSGSKIKTKRNPIFYPFIFLNLLFDIALALRDFYHWEHRNFYFYPFQLHT